MRAWLITIGEPLPSDSYGDRLFRTGMLAELLSARGHEVTWWTSAFDHVRKQPRASDDAVAQIAPNYSIRLLRAIPYACNVSLQRWQSHRAIAQRFARAARAASRPDVILCSLPPVELCRKAVRYGRRSSVPVVIDVRDLWPDLFAELAPPLLRPAARLSMWPLFRSARIACAGATAIVGVTQPYVNWGLRNAGRPTGPLDRPFAMGYRNTPPPDDAWRRAETFWNEWGIAADPSKLTVCYFGAIGRHFDFDCILGAATQLKAASAPIRFVFCGTGDCLTNCRERAAAFPNMLFPGWVASAEICWLMKHSTVGLVPYNGSQNFVANVPNKPVEYLSAGLPIVSGLQGELARLLREHDCGVNYSNGNATQLADILSDLASQPERLRTMSRNASALYQHQFVADRVYSEMADHLEHIADHRAPSSVRDTALSTSTELQQSAA